MANVTGRSALARKIISERERRRWTQADLAERAKVSRSWVAAVESGTQQSPRLSFLRRVAETLELDLAGLVAELEVQFGDDRSLDVSAVHERLDRILDNQDAMLDGLNEILASFRVIAHALIDGRMVTPELREAMLDAFRQLSAADGVESLAGEQRH